MILKNIVYNMCELEILNNFSSISLNNLTFKVFDKNANKYCDKTIILNDDVNILYYIDDSELYKISYKEIIFTDDDSNYNLIIKSMYNKKTHNIIFSFSISNVNNNLVNQLSSLSKIDISLLERRQ